MPDPTVVERLRAALDEAERVALDAAMTMVGGSWEVSRHPGRLPMVVDRGHQVAADLAVETATHVASWDPNAVQRLVKRDRALLTACERADRYVAEHVEQCGENLCSCREYVTWTATSGALRMVVERAAAFWLGDAR